MGPVTRALTQATPATAAPRRPTAAHLRALVGKRDTPPTDARRPARAQAMTPPPNIAPQRLARAKAEMRRSRLSVAQIVVALRVARAQGRGQEFIWLRQRLSVERQLFHAALAEAKAWRNAAS